jgi:hypothetical protein
MRIGSHSLRRVPPPCSSYRLRALWAGGELSPRPSHRVAADAALPDVLMALASFERRADFSRPCGARFTGLAASAG